MAKYTDISVKTLVGNIQSVVQQAFVANGFDVRWEGPLKGKAEKGSKGMNVAFGAFAQYYAVDFEIYPSADGAVLRLYQSVSGWWGGAIGRMRVEKQWGQLTATLTEWFRQQGALVGVREGKT